MLISGERGADLDQFPAEKILVLARTVSKTGNFIRENKEFEPSMVQSDFRMTFSEGTTITGLNVAFNLRCKVINEGGSYYHFSISGAFDSPLGWSLSSIARNQLEEMLPANSGDGQDGSRTRAVNTEIWPH